MKRKMKVLVVLSFLLVLLLGMSYAYSKYKSDVSGVASLDIANWHITVNDCDIVTPDETNEECFTPAVLDNENNVIKVAKNFKATDFTYDNNSNQNVVDNKIAPGSSGTFKIKIKPNDTEVSIKYHLTATLEIPNDSIELYIKGPTENSRIPLTDAGYDGLILYNANNANYVEELMIYVDWVNDDTGASDEVDTIIGTSGSAPVLGMPIEIVFEQYNG